MSTSARRRSSAPVSLTTANEQLAQLEFADNETIRYLRPELPPLQDVARYYALSEEARFYSNGGPCS
jgi:hypothetical protein